MRDRRYVPRGCTARHKVGRRRTIGSMNEPSEPKSQLISIPQVRERLGGIGRTTVWRLITAGDLQGVKVGGRSFVLESSVEDFVARQVDGCSQGAS